MGKHDFIVWTRLIFHDGKTLDIDRMEAADRKGASGLTDKINKHYLRRFGRAL